LPIANLKRGETLSADGARIGKLSGKLFSENDGIGLFGLATLGFDGFGRWAVNQGGVIGYEQANPNTRMMIDREAVFCGGNLQHLHALKVLVTVTEAANFRVHVENEVHRGYGNIIHGRGKRLSHRRTNTRSDKYKPLAGLGDYLTQHFVINIREGSFSAHKFRSFHRRHTV
jgi:hypothetical protein